MLVKTADGMHEVWGPDWPKYLPRITDDTIEYWLRTDVIGFSKMWAGCVTRPYLVKHLEACVALFVTDFTKLPSPYCSCSSQINPYCYEHGFMK